LFIDHEEATEIEQRNLDFALLSQDMSTISMLLRDCKEAKDHGEHALAENILDSVYSLLGLNQTSH
jgi:hypothetical protein